MRATYLQLLEKVAAGRQPEKVIYGNHVYGWNGNEYVYSGTSLTEQMTNWTTRAQTLAECLEYEQKILTDEERDYLRAVISPWRDDVKGIRKTIAIAGERSIVIHCYGGLTALPDYEDDRDLYSGMEADRIYTLEELGI